MIERSIAAPHSFSTALQGNRRTTKKPGTVTLTAAVRGGGVHLPVPAQLGPLHLPAGEVTDRMRHEIQERLATAGIQVIEARISHLAYAPEIAGAMLRRQQAEAVVMARQRLVEGAVGMVDGALKQLEERKIVALTPEQRAVLVTNMMTVLLSESGAQPVIQMAQATQ